MNIKHAAAESDENVFLEKYYGGDGAVRASSSVITFCYRNAKIVYDLTPFSWRIATVDDRRFLYAIICEVRKKYRRIIRTPPPYRALLVCGEFIFFKMMSLWCIIESQSPRPNGFYAEDKIISVDDDMFWELVSDRIRVVTMTCTRQSISTDFGSSMI